MKKTESHQKKRKELKRVPEQFLKKAKKRKRRGLNVINYFINIRLRKNVIRGNTNGKKYMVIGG